MLMCGEGKGRCGEKWVCCGVGSVLECGGRCREMLRDVGKCVGVWGEVWKTVRGGVWKCWGRCGKVCWGVGKVSLCGERCRGVEKCVGVWR